MYESPIEMIQNEIKKQFEDGFLKAVQSCGFIVNKGELIKALSYDRKQYDKGYSDGYNMAIDELVKEICKIYVQSERNGNFRFYSVEIKQTIADLAEQLKSGNREEEE